MFPYNHPVVFPEEEGLEEQVLENDEVPEIPEVLGGFTSLTVPHINEAGSSISTYFDSTTVPQRMYDCVVVGGGISGLSAAQQLLSLGINNILVVEAKDRVGGRTLTTEAQGKGGKTVSVDLGGQWVSSSQPHIILMLEKLGLKTFPQYNAGTHLIQMNARSTQRWSGCVPLLGPLDSLDALALLAVCEFFVYLTKKSSALLPTSYLDAISASAFIRQFSWMQSTRQLLDITVRSILGTEASLVSALYLLQYGASAGSISRLIETEKGGGQEFRIAGGAQQVSRKLASLVGEERVVLSSPVVTVQQVFTSPTSEERTVLLELEDGSVLQARTAIMATPPHLNASLKFIPSLPADYDQAVRHAAVGFTTKVVLIYEKAFWREAGLSGFMLSHEGPLTSAWDACGPGENPEYAAIVGFIIGEHAAAWTSVPFEVRRQEVLFQLKDCFGDAALSPLSYHEKEWHKEPFNGGCPVTYFGTGVNENCLRALQTPHYNVFWAGTETADCWRGFMNGAVDAGHRAAGQVWRALSPVVEIPDVPVVASTSAPSSEKVQGASLLSVVSVVMFGVLLHLAA